MAGTTNAHAWQPLHAGWNLIEFASGGQIVVVDAGQDARLQVRDTLHPNATGPGCYSAFDSGMHHEARSADGKAAVMHNVDRHLLLIPYGQDVQPDRNPTLAEM